MRSAKSGPNLWQIWQVFGPWASPYGANGQITMTVHNYRPRQFHRTSNGENPSSGYRDMGSASLAAARPAARPPARTVTTIPLQPEGLRGKKPDWWSWPWGDLTLKIKGQSHGWDQMSKLYTGSNIVSIEFISLSFHAKQTLPSRPLPEMKQFENWTLKIQGQGHLVWVQHSFNSYHFRFLPIGHPVPEIQPFKNFTLKIQCQGHYVATATSKFGESVHNPC